MKKQYLKLICLGLFILLASNECTTDNEYSIPTLDCIEPNSVPTKTVRELWDLATAIPQLQTEDDIIEAYVVSSDKEGHFFKTLFLLSLDYEIGFCLLLDDISLFTEYRIGQKIYIHLKGLYIEKQHHLLKIASAADGNSLPISTPQYKKHITKSCYSVIESTISTAMDLNTPDSTLIGKLVTLKKVQFIESVLGQTYYNPENTFGLDTRHPVTDSLGNRIILKTSSFASYATTAVAFKSGSIRGILTRYNNEYQLTPRYASDLTLTEPRFTIAETPEAPVVPTDPDPETPEEPDSEGHYLFPYGNLENFNGFLTAIIGSSLPEFVQHSIGTGFQDSNCLHLTTNAQSATTTVFTAFPNINLPSTYSKIKFYLKGSAAKSISINLYKTDGSYYKFNLRDITTNTTLTNENTNKYNGTIATSGQWVLITLDLQSLTAINTTLLTNPLFSLKIGNNSNYDIYMDHFTIE